MASCTERFGDNVEGFISGVFYSLGTKVGNRPRWTIGLALLLTVAMGAGFAFWETENRGEELWVPQDTTAEEETTMYDEYFPNSSRISTMIVQSRTKGANVLTKESLLDAIAMHDEIESGESIVDNNTETFVSICTKAGGSCVSEFDGVCSCLLTSILKQWNYDLDTLTNDQDYMATLNGFGTQEDFDAVLGNPEYDSDGTLISADAFTLSYFIQSNAEVVDGSEVDEVGEAWEEDVFFSVAESVPEKFPSISVDYFASRSFEDVFGDAIGGDLVLVQISYVVALLFLAANLGRVKCGQGSRWTLSLGALLTIGLSTAAGFGLSSLCGLFFGPVHSLLPFILLGIGVDDAFVIVNAFDRERKGPRSSEDNEQLAQRCARALARAGASITVTSATDLVAFGISASSSLPALASFCAYAAICIFFLWLFASTFFTATMVLDERRQRENRRECLCCLTRKAPEEGDDDDDDVGFQEDYLAGYFRKHHGPFIMSSVGKGVVLTIFAGLLGFGIWGALNLEVEDSEQLFIPEDSYLADYFDKADTYYPDTGVEVLFTFEGSSSIYDKRQDLANLADRLSGLSSQSPYIAEPTSETTYQNVMAGLLEYLSENGSDSVGNATLGDDGWPTSEEDFVLTMTEFASFSGPGAKYVQDVSFSEDGSALDAFRVHSEYVRLTKLKGGEIIDDADRQIDAMDDTRSMVDRWTDLPSAFPYSAKFITIEGFKIIKRELFLNVGLSILAVGIIVFLTVASPITSLLITFNVAACIIEILGFMKVIGIVIDSVSVINIVLAVGISVDYSAHVGHCFMTKPGDDKNQRVIESLADIGKAVLSGAISTFLAVAVLLFSSSYVFQTLSIQFALTVGLGITHGLVLLPVLLSIFGPKPFSTAHLDDKTLAVGSKSIKASVNDQAENDDAAEK